MWLIHLPALNRRLNVPFSAIPTKAPTDTSPCVGICRIGEDGLCVGCRRNLDEIGAWNGMSDAQRRQWIREVQPTRPQPAKT
ncbi:MAG: DUF1289 domain-containing protein [Sinobacteraceae bacterium]|nr:DUF1289 domain-containing protein [Nevskiaceae bacterium]